LDEYVISSPSSYIKMICCLFNQGWTWACASHNHWIIYAATTIGRRHEAAICKTTLEKHPSTPLTFLPPTPTFDDATPTSPFPLPILRHSNPQPYSTYEETSQIDTDTACINGHHLTMDSTKNMIPPHYQPSSRHPLQTTHPESEKSASTQLKDILLLFIRIWIFCMWVTKMIIFYVINVIYNLNKRK
jgi:hypothetical protein